MPLTKIKSLGITDGTIALADLSATGTASASTFLRGDNAWGAVSAGIIQIKQTLKTDTFSSSSSSFTDITGMSISITPTLSTSKILVVVDMKVGGTSTGTPTIYKLLRGSTDIYIGDSSSSRSSVFAAHSVADGTGYPLFCISSFFIDNPATTSATTYKIQMKTDTSPSHVNKTHSDNDNSNYPRTASTITVIELAQGIL